MTLNSGFGRLMLQYDCRISTPREYWEQKGSRYEH
jgi:hypothetical protein